MFPENDTVAGGGFLQFVGPPPPPPPPPVPLPAQPATATASSAAADRSATWGGTRNTMGRGGSRASARVRAARTPVDRVPEIDDLIGQARHLLHRLLPARCRLPRVHSTAPAY